MLLVYIVGIIQMPDRVLGVTLEKNEPIQLPRVSGAYQIPLTGAAGKDVCFLGENGETVGQLLSVGSSMLFISPTQVPLRFGNIECKDLTVQTQGPVIIDGEVKATGRFQMKATSLDIWASLTVGSQSRIILDNACQIAQHYGRVSCLGSMEIHAQSIINGSDLEGQELILKARTQIENCGQIRAQVKLSTDTPHFYNKRFVSAGQSYTMTGEAFFNSAGIERDKAELIVGGLYDARVDVYADTGITQVEGVASLEVKKASFAGAFSAHRAIITSKECLDVEPTGVFRAHTFLALKTDHVLDFQGKAVLDTPPASEVPGDKADKADTGIEMAAGMKLKVEGVALSAREIAYTSPGDVILNGRSQSGYRASTGESIERNATRIQAARAYIGGEHSAAGLLDARIKRALDISSGITAEQISLTAGLATVHQGASLHATKEVKLTCKTGDADISGRVVSPQIAITADNVCLKTGAYVAGYTINVKARHAFQKVRESTLTTTLEAADHAHAPAGPAQVTIESPTINAKKVDVPAGQLKLVETNGGMTLADGIRLTDEVADISVMAGTALALSFAPPTLPFVVGGYAVYKTLALSASGFKMLYDKMHARPPRTTAAKVKEAEGILKSVKSTLEIGAVDKGKKAYDTLKKVYEMLPQTQQNATPPPLSLR